jgi:dipeptidyl aminopeptidase/acylaminoacyl peptidase
MSEAPLLPVGDFFDSPVASGASISPDGRRIAYLAPEAGRMNVWVRPVDGGDAVCVTHDHRRGIAGYQWTDDPRWLLYTQDRDGDENLHLYRVDLDDPGADAVDLTPSDGVRVLQASQPGGRPGTVFVTLNLRRRELFDVHSITIATGQTTVVAENPGHLAQWFWGRSGELFATAIPDGGGVQVLAWDDVSDGGCATGRLITTYDGADLPNGLFPIQVTPDGSGIWVGSNRDQDFTRVVRLDVATGEETLVDSHPDFDLDVRGSVSDQLPFPLLLSVRTGELLGIRYLGARQEIRALDPHFGAVLSNVEKLSDGDLASITSDSSEQRWVVSFSHDTEPGLTYVYDHATGASELLFRPYPRLDPATLAPMLPVSIPTRDGLSLQCYLTLPVGVAPVGLPLVVHLHGGPWFRDAWGFSPPAQFLANRGCAVLQVNMRGSTGFGKSFIRAAIREFAGAMHDDVIDAVVWAVNQGFVDRERIGIFGGSYGGYAALVGVTFTPHVFAAAIDYCGISSLPNFLRTLPPYWRPMIGNNWYTYVGDPDDPHDHADMLARSPITRVDEIRTPLLVIQGANDARVVKAESDNIVESVRARGGEVEYLVKDDEGHGFQNPENVIDVYVTIERFLGRHLGSGVADRTPA